MDMPPMPMSPPMDMPPMTMIMNTNMHRSFYWGKDAIILFTEWPGTSFGMYFLALFFVLILGITIEVLSVAVSKRGTNPKAGALVQACVHTLRMALAYMVMLAVMSYNIGIFIAAVVGHGIGLFLVRAFSRNAGHDSSSDIAKV